MAHDITNHPYLLPLENLGLHNRFMRALRSQCDFQYAGQFCFLGSRELNKFPYLGKKGADTIAAALTQNGIVIGSEDTLAATSQEFAAVIMGGKDFLQSVINGENPHYAFVKGLASNTTIMFKAACAQAGVKPSAEELQNAERDARLYALRRARELKV